MSYHAVGPMRPVLGLERSALGRGVGDGSLAPPVCPACSYYFEGQCVWCEEGSAQPECIKCKGKIPIEESRPWYTRAEFTVPIVSTVVATVVSAVFLARLGYR